MSNEIAQNDFASVRQSIVAVISSAEKLFIIYETLNYDKSGFEKLFASSVPIGDMAIDVIGCSVEFIGEVDDLKKDIKSQSNQPITGNEILELAKQIVFHLQDLFFTFTKISKTRLTSSDGGRADNYLEKLTAFEHSVIAFHNVISSNAWHNALQIHQESENEQISSLVKENELRDSLAITNDTKDSIIPRIKSLREVISLLRERFRKHFEEFPKQVKFKSFVHNFEQSICVDMQYNMHNLKRMAEDVKANHYALDEDVAKVYQAMLLFLIEPTAQRPSIASTTLAFSPSVAALPTSPAIAILTPPTDASPGSRAASPRAQSPATTQPAAIDSLPLVAVSEIPESTAPPSNVTTTASSTTAKAVEELGDKPCKSPKRDTTVVVTTTIETTTVSTTTTSEKVPELESERAAMSTSGHSSRTRAASLNAEEKGGNTPSILIEEANANPPSPKAPRGLSPRADGVPTVDGEAGQASGDANKSHTALKSMKKISHNLATSFVHKTTKTKKIERTEIEIEGNESSQSKSPSNLTYSSHSSSHASSTVQSSLLADLGAPETFQTTPLETFLKRTDAVDGRGGWDVFFHMTTHLFRQLLAMTELKVHKLFSKAQKIVEDLTYMNEIFWMMSIIAHVDISLEQLNQLSSRMNTPPFWYRYEDGLPLLKQAIERGKSAVASAHSDSFGPLSMTSMAFYGAKNLFVNDNFFINFHRVATVADLKKFFNMPDHPVVKKFIGVTLPMIHTSRKVYIPSPNGKVTCLLISAFDVNTRLIEKSGDSSPRKMRSSLDTSGEGDSRPAGEKKRKKEKPPVEHDVILNFHGGGFVAGSPQFHETYLRDWAIRSRAIVISVDYALSPESQFPEAVMQCYSVYRWLRLHALETIGVQVGRIVLTGDSAGGNLVFTVTYKAYLDGLRPPDGLYAAYPAMNLARTTLSSPSRVMFFHDVLVPVHFLFLCLDCYMPEGLDPMHWLCSPLFAPEEVLRALPPHVFIASASYDPILDDATNYVRRLDRLGVPYEHKTYYLPHGFLNFAVPLIPEAAKAKEDGIVVIMKMLEGEAPILG